MANLPESPIYEEGIYQLETTDPVQGGVNGVDNLPLKQLANRTAFLKAKADATNVALAAHVSAADPYPQYVKTSALSNTTLDGGVY